QNKESVKTLFGEVASKISDRPGGYTRIIKMGDVRVGDNAEMCLIELVDFNTLYTKDGAVQKAKTRRSRRGGKKDGVTEAEVVSETPEAGAKPAAEEKKAKKPAAPKKTATKKPKDKE
ncbi:MAG TPA: bL17 family ribosomal protein, partial [Chryseolinea sp.]|nr:bL17 family ribosomal protein [Chryseolinea sp.]